MAMISISDAVRATAQAVVAGGDLDTVVQLPAIWDIDKATLAKDIRGSILVKNDGSFAYASERRGHLK